MRPHHMAVVFTLAVTGIGRCGAQDDPMTSCAYAIAYNKSEIDYNYASRLAVWETVDRATFDKRKTEAGLGVTVYGVPLDFTYEQFDEARTRLRQSFALQQDINYSLNSRWQAVDPNSNERYISCIDAASRKKFTATMVIANKLSVYVRVKKIENLGQLNKDSVVVAKVTGGTADRKKVVLAGTAATTLTFTRKPGEAFDVALVLLSPDGSDLDSAQFSIPKYSKIENRPQELTEQSNVVRCENTFIGPAQALMVAVASINETFEVGTHKLGYTILDGRAGPGAVVGDFTSVGPRRIEMAGRCASSDNKTTMPVNMWFTVLARKDYYVDVGAEANLLEVRRQLRKIERQASRTTQ